MTHSSKRLLFAILVWLLAASQGWSQAPLYITDGDTLFALNTSTIALSTIGSFNFPPNPDDPFGYHMVQITYDRNHHFLYGASGLGFQQWAIDPTTAQAFGPFQVPEPPYPDHPVSNLFAMTYNPWNNHIYAIGNNSVEGFNQLDEVNPYGWEFVQIRQYFPESFYCVAFDEWTGYLLAGGSTVAIFDPGTGHVDGSLEQYPIPDLSGCGVFSLSVDPTTADIYFTGATPDYPYAQETNQLFRVSRGTGEITLVASNLPGYAIAFGESP